MKLKSIKLEAFRGFFLLEEHFPDVRTIIFIGRNGVGKTSLLEAIAHSLSWLPARLRSAAGKGSAIKETDIYNGEEFSRVTIEVEQEGVPFNWYLYKNRPGRKALDSSEFGGLQSLVTSWQTALSIDEQASLPLFAYYPVDRSVTDVKLEPSSKKFSQLDACHNAFSKASSFNSFFEWFRNREDLENQQRLKLENLKYQDIQLKAVRTAISSFLPELSKLQVLREGIPSLQAIKNEQIIVINQLSDGEKCLLALVGDLARRLALSNPAAKEPLEGEGIVLIDEVELHLHPKWQRGIVPKLEETFPQCQFILSTHSPQVLGDAEGAAMYSLDPQADKPVQLLQEPIYGRDTAHLLEEVMGADSRSVSIREKLDKLFFLLDELNIAEARCLLGELKSRLGDDPELIRAGILLKRREKLGK